MARASRLLARTAAAIVSGVVSAAGAENYPSREIHFVVGFPPGSGADTVTRFMAQKIRVASGKPVIVENKTGAAGKSGIPYAGSAAAERRALGKCRSEGYAPARNLSDAR